MEFPALSVAFISFALLPIIPNPFALGIEVVSFAVTAPGFPSFPRAAAGRIILNPAVGSDMVPHCDGVMGVVIGFARSARVSDTVPTDTSLEPNKTAFVRFAVCPSTAIFNFPLQKFAGTSVSSKVPPVQRSTSFPNHLVFSAPLAFSQNTLMNAFFPERSTLLVSVPVMRMVELIGLRAMFQNAYPVPVTIPVNERLCSYPGFRIIASNSVPAAMSMVNTPPEFVLTPDTCFFVRSRISMNASLKTVLEPLAVTVPVIGTSFRFPARFMDIVRFVLASKAPDPKTSPIPVTRTNTWYCPDGTLSNTYPVEVRKVCLKERPFVESEPPMVHSKFVRSDGIPAPVNETEICRSVGTMNDRDRSLPETTTSFMTPMSP